MPNHVNHKFLVRGDSNHIKQFQESCFTTSSEDGSEGRPEFDFDTLILRPEVLKKTIAGNTAEMQTEEYAAIEAQAIAETGYKNWYDWSLACWGTKWNAYHTYFGESLGSDTELQFEFDTAWSCPEPIFEKLAERFPSLSFNAYALDEGYGFGAEITIENGQFEISYFDVNAGFMEAFGA